jgi:trigger factor
VKVTTEESEGSQIVLDMEIEPERIEKAMERAYRRIVSRVNVPGFRRGKAPRAMIERVVGRETLMSEAMEILLPEAYQEAVNQTGIDPVDVPKLDVVSAEPLSVRATVAVRPRVEMGDYRAIRQSQQPVEITEEQVDKTMESLRESRGQWIAVERASETGDLVTIDIRGRTESKEFLNSQALQVLLDPERPVLAPGVVEQIAGMQAGDHKAFDIALPEDFADKEIAGQEAALEVAVNAIKERQVPEMDDELAKDMGEYASVDELRTAIRREMEEQAQAQARRSLEASVVDAVVEQAKVEPPQTWVDRQAQALRESTQQRLRGQGISEPRYLQVTGRTEASYMEELASDARRQLRRTLVLNAVADAEGITVTDEEVDTAIEQAAGAGEGTVSPEERERLRPNVRSVLREQKTVARLVEIAEGAEGSGEQEEEDQEDATERPTRKDGAVDEAEPSAEPEATTAQSEAEE